MTKTIQIWMTKTIQIWMTKIIQIWMWDTLYMYFYFTVWPETFEEENFHEFHGFVAIHTAKSSILETGPYLCDTYDQLASCLLASYFHSIP